MLSRDSECTSDEFTVQLDDSGFGFGAFELVYEGITANIVSTGFTITCTNFRNPTYPQTTTDFTVKVIQQPTRRDFFEILELPAF
jgi:hypothetical protein